MQNDYDIFIVLNPINPTINHHYFLVNLYINKDLIYGKQSSYLFIKKLTEDFNFRVNDSYLNNNVQLFDIRLNPLIDIKKYLNNLIKFLDENNILHNDIKLK